MAGYTPDYVNLLLLPVIISMIVSFFVPQYELAILYGLLAAVLMAHIHYGCSVVSVCVCPIVWVGLNLCQWSIYMYSDGHFCEYVDIKICSRNYN